MKIRADRLQKCIQALEECKEPGRFNMHTFAHSCGTPGCVLGLLAARRDLQRTFRLDKRLRLVDAKGRMVFADGEEVQNYFGLSMFEAEDMFGQEGCGGASTTEEAVDYIQKFIGDNT